MLVFEEKIILEIVPLRERYQIRKEEDTLSSRLEKNPAGFGVYVCGVEWEIKNNNNNNKND